MYLVVGCTMGDVYERKRKWGVIQDNKGGHSTHSRVSCLVRSRTGMGT